MRTPVLLLAAVLGLGSGVLSQTPGNSGIQLQGIVRDADTGRPLPQVGIRIGEQAATTDAAGRFTVSRLSAGRQRLSANGVGYILDGLSDPKVTQRTAYRANGVFVNLGPETPLQVSLYMWPSPFVTGTVFDSFGQPVFRATVRILRFGYDNEGKPGLTGMAPIGETDDRGEFETESLAPGEYVFRVEKTRPETDPRDQYLPTFYPVNSDPFKPETVVVRPAVTTRLPRIILTSAPSAHVHIRPLNETGSDDPGLVYANLRRRGDAGVLYQSTNSTIGLRLSQGFYDVEVGALRYSTGSVSSDLAHAAISHATLEVRDKDIDFPVKLVPGTRVEGRVVKRERNGETVPVTGAQVRFLSNASLLSARSFGATAAADGTFAISSLPEGTYQLHVPHYGEETTSISERQLLAAPRDVCFSEVQQNNVPFSGDQITITGRAANVTVILRDSTIRVRGRVVDSKGQAASSAIVALVPDDRSRSARYAALTADQNGDFEFTCAAAGSYRVFAWTDLPGAAYRNAEFMAKYNDRGTAVRLADGDNLTVKTELLER